MRNFFSRAKSSPAAAEVEPVSDAVLESTPNPEFPDIEETIVDVPSINVSNVEVPNIEVPDVEVPNIEVPLDEFEREFGMPAPECFSDAEPNPNVEADDSGDLEEWSEPLPESATPQLPVGAELEGPNGHLKIEEIMEVRGAENIYRALWVDGSQDEAEVGQSTFVRLREAGGVAGERLAREAMWRTHWEASGRLAMLPKIVAQFKTNETQYLATEAAPEGETLAQRFTTWEKRFYPSLPEDETATYLSETLLILAQLAAFLIRLHGTGFAHLGLRPDLIVLGKPVQVLDCSFAAPLGEELEAPLSFAGYSAPELAHPGEVDARSDIYAVGAMLYRAVTGADLNETGADFSTWQPQIVMAGVPQILRRCLGDLDTRYSSADQLHRALLKLKSRLKPAVSYEIAGLSTIGLEPTRTTNQDAFGHLSGAWETENGPVSWAAFAVADGMGGMAAGEVASEVAVNAFLRAASLWSADAATVNQSPPTGATHAQLVKDWVALANEAVVKALEARGVRGGCTLDAGFVVDRHLSLAHVGDSRFYLLRDGNFELLSRDHSFVMSLLLQGEISFDDLRAHGDRNKVTRSLGERHPQPDYFIDSLQVTQNAPTLELRQGDVLLLCSDGLWEPVLEAEMLAAVSGGDLQKAARDLLKLALQRGAPDNATLVLVRFNQGTSPVFA